MMTQNEIGMARLEAERFIIKCNKAIVRLKAQEGIDYPLASSKEVAALRRASMDLTRVLAELRKK